MSTTTYHLSTATNYRDSALMGSLYSAPTIEGLRSAADDSAVQDRLAMGLVGLRVWAIDADGDATKIGTGSSYDASEDWEGDEHPAQTMAMAVGEAVDSAIDAMIASDWLSIPDRKVAIEAIRCGAYGSCGLDTWAARIGLEVHDAADRILAAAQA